MGFRCNYNQESVQALEPATKVLESAYDNRLHRVKRYDDLTLLASQSMFKGRRYLNLTNLVANQPEEADISETFLPKSTAVK